MISHREFVLTDGCCTTQSFSVNCSPEFVRTDSFVVPGNNDKSISIRSEISCCAEIFCNKVPSITDRAPAFYIQSEIAPGSIYSVKNIQSTAYRIAEHISNSLFITINALKGFFAAVSRRIRQAIINMKGKQCGYRGYALSLLRL